MQSFLLSPPSRRAGIILNLLNRRTRWHWGRGGGEGKEKRAASLGFRKGLNLINSIEHSVELSVCGLTSASLPPFMDKRERFPRDFMLSNSSLPLRFPFPLFYSPYSFLSHLRRLVVRFQWTYVRAFAWLLVGWMRIANGRRSIRLTSWKVDFRDVDRKMQFPGCKNLYMCIYCCTERSTETFYDGIKRVKLTINLISFNWLKIVIWRK